MIRALWLFLLLAIIGVVAAWFADLPGNVTIAFPDREVHTSLQVLAGFVLAASVATILVYRFVSMFVAMPGEFTRWSATRRRRKGFLALTRGLVAVAAGDGEDARRQTKRALALVGDTSSFGSSGQ